MVVMDDAIFRVGWCERRIWDAYYIFGIDAPMCPIYNVSSVTCEVRSATSTNLPGKNVVLRTRFIARRGTGTFQVSGRTTVGLMYSEKISKTSYYSTSVQTGLVCNHC